MAKSATEQAVSELQGEFDGLANMLVDRMAIEDTQVGTDIDDLKPTAGHAAAAVYDDEQWPSKAFPEGADILAPGIVAQAVENITMDNECFGINAGPSDDGGGGGGGEAAPAAGGKDKESQGPSTGSEGDGGGGGPLSDKTPLPGLGDTEQDAHGEEKKEEKEPHGGEKEENELGQKEVDWDDKAVTPQPQLPPPRWQIQQSRRQRTPIWCGRGCTSSSAATVAYQTVAELVFHDREDC